MRELNRCLFRLKFFKGIEVYDQDFDVKNIPDDIIYNVKKGAYFKVETNNTTKEDLDRFIKVKNAYNFNVIRICVTNCTVFFILAVCFMIYYIVK